jgi:hypothetical protein
MVLDGELPAGLAVNAAGVLAVTLGRRVEELVGPDVVDGSGEAHAGIVNVPISVLKADAGEVGEVRARAADTAGLLVVGFTDIAQTSRTYEEYTQRMAATSPEGLGYLGVALYGEKRLVNKITGSLPLLR